MSGICSTSREETMGGIMYHVALVERRLWVV